MCVCKPDTPIESPNPLLPLAGGGVDGGVVVVALVVGVVVAVVVAVVVGVVTADMRGKSKQTEKPFVCLSC